MMVPITELVSTSGKCKPEEQSGRFAKIRSVRNHGRRRTQNGMIAVNQGNLIPRLTRSKTADQALQAPDNLTHPTNKPWEDELVLIPTGTSKEVVELDNSFLEKQKKLESSMMRALIAGHSQETSDKITELPNMS
eukprot:9081696-Ditylum_brightwellii.AAC.1